MLHALRVATLARHDLPAKRIAVLIAQEHDADLAHVAQPLLGAITLGHFAAATLKIRVGHVEEQRGERAIALLVALGQLSLKVGVYAVKIFQRPMDSRVVGMTAYAIVSVPTHADVKS